MIYRLAADLVLTAVFGGILVQIWRVHLPIILWSSMVNLASWTSPLTPLENRFRLAAGERDTRVALSNTTSPRMAAPFARTRVSQEAGLPPGYAGFQPALSAQGRIRQARQAGSLRTQDDGPLCQGSTLPRGGTFDGVFQRPRQNG